MSSAVYNVAFTALAADDSVGDAVDRMLGDRLSDLPVLDAGGRFLGMFGLASLLGFLLPRAATIGDAGIPDLAFAAETLEQIRARLHGIAGTPVREFVAPPEHVVAPDVSPVEIVLLLHRGANNVPVVDPATGRLVATATARDVLAALHGGRDG